MIARINILGINPRAIMDTGTGEALLGEEWWEKMKKKMDEQKIQLRHSDKILEAANQ